MKSVETTHQIGEEFLLFAKSDPIVTEWSQFGHWNYKTSLGIDIDGTPVPLEVYAYRPRDEINYQLFLGVCIFYEEDGVTVFKPISPDLLQSLKWIRLQLKLPDSEQIYEATPEEKQLKSGLVWFQNFSPQLSDLKEFTQITSIWASFLKGGPEYNEPRITPIPPWLRNTNIAA